MPYCSRACILFYVFAKAAQGASKENCIVKDGEVEESCNLQSRVTAHKKNTSQTTCSNPIQTLAACKAAAINKGLIWDGSRNWTDRSSGCLRTITDAHVNWNKNTDGHDSHPDQVPFCGDTFGGSNRCESAELPSGTKCSGCPPMFNGKLCASTTHYTDPTKGSCGQGATDPVPKDFWTMTKFTAAFNCVNLDPEDPLKSWCPKNCGQCYRLCGTGGTIQATAAPEGECRVFKITNRCGDGYGQYAEWCSGEMTYQQCQADPSQCAKAPNTNKYGYPAHFDLQTRRGQILPSAALDEPLINDGLNWDNPEVTFELVDCSEWDGPAWDPQCPSAPDAS